MTGERGGHAEEPKGKDIFAFAAEIFDSLPPDLQAALVRDLDETADSARTKPEDDNEGDK